MKTVYKHIYFEDISNLYVKRKTETWNCYNNSGIFLGTVEWNCGWRQYWFISENRCGFSFSCLNNIADFIKQLIARRKLNILESHKYIEAKDAHKCRP